MKDLTRIKKTYLALTCFSLVLVALGGFVRSTGAGLACPDWPLCHGMMIPPLEGGIIQEYLHRLLAGIVAVLTMYAATLCWKKRAAYSRLWKTSIFLVFLVAVQAVMGGLTVLLVLNPYIVTGHLILGTSFFLCASLLAGELVFTKRTSKPVSRWYKRLAGFVTILAFAQIGLGGFVATSGASLACPDFPLCNGKFLPPGLHNAQVVQLLHGGVGTLLLVLLIILVGSAPSAGLKKKGHLMGVTGLVFLQIMLGTGSVHMKIPVFMVVLHLVVAQFILLGLASFYQRLTPAWWFTEQREGNAIPINMANQSSVVQSEKGVARNG